MSALARNVRLLRSSKGWNQTDLAAYMGGHGWVRQTVGETEHGHRVTFRPDELVTLSIIFGVSVDDLLHPLVLAPSREASDEEKD